MEWRNIIQSKYAFYFIITAKIFFLNSLEQ